MELKDLIGEHVLTGCDHGTSGDANTISFVLDGVTYRVDEDPEDGYRSSAKDIVVSDQKIVNVFQGVKVIGSMSDDALLHLVDAAGGDDVICVGTDHSDDYYPCFISVFTPENMAVNAAK